MLFWRLVKAFLLLLRRKGSASASFIISGGKGMDTLIFITAHLRKYQDQHTLSLRGYSFISILQ